MKHLKTRIAGIALAVSMLFGSTTVLAVSSADTSTMSDATTILYDQSVHVELSSSEQGKWYCYTATQTGVVYFYSYNNINSEGKIFDTYLRIYDSSGNQKTTNDDGYGNGNFGLRYKVEEGKVYYIWVCKYYEDEAGSFDFAISYPSLIEIISDGSGVVEGTGISLGYSVPTGTSPAIVLDPNGLDGSTYQWYRYSYFDQDFVEISGATSSTLTVGDLGDQFRVEVTHNSIPRLFTFNIRRVDYDPRVDSGIVQTLANVGETATAVAPGLSGTNTSSVGYAVCPFYYNMWLPEVPDSEPDMPIYQNPVTIPAFNRTVFDTVYPTEEFFTTSYNGAPCNFMGGTLSIPKIIPRR